MTSAGHIHQLHIFQDLAVGFTLKYVEIKRDIDSDKDDLLAGHIHQPHISKDLAVGFTLKYIEIKRDRDDFCWAYSPIPYLPGSGRRLYPEICRDNYRDRESDNLLAGHSHQLHIFQDLAVDFILEYIEIKRDRDRDDFCWA